MTAAHYLRLEGQCFGNILRLQAISEAKCGEACLADKQCKGYVYIFSDKRPFLDNACTLKKEMCTGPMMIYKIDASTYFRIDSKGKLLYVMQILFVNCLFI